MKYYAQFDGQEIAMDIHEEGGALIIQIGDEAFTVDLQKVSEPSLYSMLVNHRSAELMIEEREGLFDVLVGGELYRIGVQDEWAYRLANIQRKTRPHEGELLVKAPMPGVVVDVEVDVGTAVEAGQGLLILEAMKMENEIRAPRAGTVKVVGVRKGESVEQGRVLVILA
jgi:biotin carboxyl carrier protein